jgi:hypothetical protein
MHEAKQNNQVPVTYHLPWCAGDAVFPPFPSCGDTNITWRVSTDSNTKRSHV